MTILVAELPQLKQNVYLSDELALIGLGTDLLAAPVEELEIILSDRFDLAVSAGLLDAVFTVALNEGKYVDSGGAFYRWYQDDCITIVAGISRTFVRVDVDAKTVLSFKEKYVVPGPWIQHVFSLYPQALEKQMEKSARFEEQRRVKYLEILSR